MRISFSSVRAVRGDWSLSADGTFGEGIHLVCGDVGSGKSTLALLAAGLFPPAEGSIEREGIASQAISFQFPEVHVTGRNLTEEIRSWNADPPSVLAASGLDGRETTHPLNLSRGELKRLILSCALARAPDLLILDEPFSSLDCVEKDRLCSVLSGRTGGITIILTHEQSWFPRTDRIWEIVDGMLHDRGELPGALRYWDHAPALVKDLVGRGKMPKNITRNDLLEAACRI